MQNIIIQKRDAQCSLISMHGVPEDESIQTFYNRVQDVTEPEGNWYLLFRNINLEGHKHKRLADMNIRNNTTLNLIFRCLGGTNLEPLEGWVTLTREPCSIYYTEPDYACYNAKMKCGYVISPEAMTGHIENSMKKGNYRFSCPHCNMEWPYFVVKHVGCFTDEQQQSIESQLVEVYMEKAMGIQKCPQCYNYCHRVNTTNPRVVCGVCTKKQNGELYEFCWCCLKKWCNSGTKQCGNSACDGSDARNKYLRECPKAVMQYSKIECPQIRACPFCGVLIHHHGGCKTMHCEHCRKGFCFVCLLPVEEGELKCGSLSAKCQLAPVQQF